MNTKANPDNQYVCTICGFNMIGYYPEYCPFCGAPNTVFLTSEECSNRYSVKGTPVNKNVLRLNSVPKLGLEHSAYRVTTDEKTYWIDCPSCFDNSLSPVDDIIFTHHHFLGASNQYRQLFSSKVRINKLDSVHKISQAFTFDDFLKNNFIENGIEAFHVDGHTPGFMFYIFKDLLFICDYVHIYRDKMIFNPFGPKKKTAAGGQKINEIIKNKDIKTVCGFDYVQDYPEWKEKFDLLIN